MSFRLGWIAMLAALIVAGCAAESRGSEAQASPPMLATPANRSSADSGAKSVTPQAAAPASDPGAISGAPGDDVRNDLQESSMSAAPTGWSTLTNQQYRFSIAYPDAYTVLDEPVAPPADLPDLVFRARFQDREIAASDTADLNPPMFSIEIFANPGQLALDAWIDRQGPRGSRRELTIGGKPGYEVTLPTQLAPNQFLYVAHDAHVFRLIPLGPFSADMLRSFTLGG